MTIRHEACPRLSLCLQMSWNLNHYDYVVIMGAMASQITSFTVAYSTVYSGADQGKHWSSASMAFVQGIHRWPVNSPHKGPVTRKMSPFDDVIIRLEHNDRHLQTTFSTAFSWMNIAVFLFKCHWNMFLNTLRPRQNGCRLVDGLFECIFLNKNVWISMTPSLKFVPEEPINDIPPVIQIMARHTEQGTSRYLNQWWSLYWRKYVSVVTELSFQLASGQRWFR